MTSDGSLSASRGRPQPFLHTRKFSTLRIWIEKHPAIILSILSLLFLLIIVPVAFFKYRTYQMGFDLAQNEQAIWNTSQGRFFQTSAFGYTKYDFDDGPVLLQAVIAPIYLLFPSTYTLLLLQSFALGLAIFPLYYIAASKLQSPWAGYGLVIAYLLHPSVQHLALYQFEPRAFAIVPLLLAFYSLERNRYRPFCIFFLLAMLAKTEVSLVVVMMGVYALITRKQRRFVFTPIAVGGAWLVIVALIIIPQFAGSRLMLTAYGYGALGGSPGEVLLTLATRPLFVLEYVFSSAKLDYLFTTFRAVGFVSLLQPQVLLLSLPIFAENLLSPRSVQFSLNYQYQAMIFPVVFVATVYGIGWLVRRVSWLRRRNSIAVLLLTALVIVSTGSLTLNASNQVLRALKHPESQARIDAAEQMISLVPSGAAVAASSGVGAHMGRRQSLYFFPGGASYPAELVDQAQYLLADEKGADGKVQEALQKVRSSGQWQVVAQREGYTLFRKVLQ